MRIHLEHIGNPETSQGRMQGWNMLTILGSNNRLGEGSLEHPALLHPGRIEGGNKALEMGQELGHHFLFAHREERIVHRAIVAEVEEVPPAVFVSRTEVGMLKEAGEGVARITNIDPVAVGHLAIQGKDETVSAIRLSP